MKLSQEQRKRVMDNLGLVRKVIQDKVHSPCQLGFYSYDDIYQIGCVGLCKAAATDRGGVFSTYAYRLIWHEICSALIYATKRFANTRTKKFIMKTKNGVFQNELTPFVRQYDILNNKWGALLCRKEYQTNAIHQNSRSR